MNLKTRIALMRSLGFKSCYDNGTYLSANIEWAGIALVFTSSYNVWDILSEIQWCNKCAIYRSDNDEL